MHKTARILIFTSFLFVSCFLIVPKAQATTVIDIFAGNQNSCAVFSDNTVKCWGYNYYGQLGDGTTNTSTTPVAVSGISTATSVSMGGGHTCARLSDGTVKCWGRNSSGQLGDGSTTQSTTPVTVTGISTATVVATGGNWSCARLSDGTVKCWGYGGNGELGNGANSSSSTPVTVTGITTATTVAARGNHSCAVIASGAVNCWGSNYYGQLGDGTTNNSNVPVAVTGITTATAVSVGGYHVCARLSDGTIKCWGENWDGQLGNGTYDGSTTPVTVTGITTATTISTKSTHNCARLSDGTVKCWGAGPYGELGNGTYDGSTTPVAVSGITTATAVSMGGYHACVLYSDGAAACWGYNGDGQLGDGTNNDSLTPVLIPGTYTVSAPSIASPTSTITGDSATVSALFNRNYGTTTTHFLWGTSNVACSSLPNTTGETDISSYYPNSPEAYTATVGGLIPGTTYYYCPVSFNSAGIAYGSVNSFAPSAGGSTCGGVSDNSDYTVSGNCVFNKTIDGIDKGTGSKNAGLLQITSGQTLTVSPGQIVSYGILYKPGASIARFTGGTLKRGAVWEPDADGDGYPDTLSYSSMKVSDTQPTGYVRRIVANAQQIDCAPNDATRWHYATGTEDADGDTYTAKSYTRPVCIGVSLAAAGCVASVSTVDCNDSNASTYQNVASIATDYDNDGHYFGTQATTCVGSSSTINTRTYYKDEAGNYAYTAQGASGDCDDTNDTYYQNLTGYTDIDGDASYTAQSRNVCSGVALPAGNSASPGTDCNDGNVLRSTWKTNITQIATGNYHACALLSGGSVQCWGSNSDGQLGDGTYVSTGSATTVNGISTAIQVSAFRSYSCALISGGSIKCWGYNGWGNLGDGTYNSSTTPVSVSGISTATQVATSSAENLHTCARLSNGTVKCWGYNGYGQLGDGSTYDSTTPVTVTGISNATEVTVGTYYSCARLSDGTVKCWGYNYYGELGDGSTYNSTTPVTVSGISTATQIAAGGYYHTCARLSDSTIKCWGYNGYGQLGDGTYNSSTTPVSVTGITTATSVSVMLAHTCARLSDSTIKCWGNNGYGQLGNGTTISSSIPVSVTGISTALQVSAGQDYTCARLSSGSSQCWGYNGYGQLGNSQSQATSPVSVVNISTATQVAAGGGSDADSSCALLTGGTVKCWGENYYGQLGNGTTNNSSIPVVVNGLTAVTQISEGVHGHFCARLSSGQVKCWGNNGYGQLGDGTYNDASTPITVAGISTATQVITGGHISCALLSGGTVKCWGDNSNGQLGDGTFNESLTPVTVAGITNATEIIAGHWHTCALITGGTIKCWGYNYEGELGNGTTTTTGNDGIATPVTVAGISTATQLGAGESHTCARLSNSTVKCWGANWDGQLGVGDNNYNDSSVPVAVTGISNASGVSTGTGANHSCAVLADNTVVCWGNGGDYQLGNGLSNSYDYPVAVTGISTATQVAAGPSHSCARLSTGVVKCWGSDYLSALGQGGIDDLTVPYSAVCN